MKLVRKKKEQRRLPALALLVTIEALPGKEGEVEQLLAAAAPALQDEPDTLCWYAVKLSPVIFGIFATFQTRAGQAAHLAGQLVASLQELSPQLLITSPHIQHLEVVAAKVPDA